MITTTAVSPYARYGRPTVTTFPADAARIGVYFGAAMSIPLWKPPQRAPKPDVMGPRSGHIESVVPLDRKSTRLNSSHRTISYAVFCLKKKKKYKKRRGSKI